MAHSNSFYRRSSTYRLPLLAMLVTTSLAPAVAAPPPPAPSVISRLQAEHFLRVAKNLVDRGDAKSAVGFYQRALLTFPDNVDGIVGMGEAMMAAGQPLEATILFQQLLFLKPQDPRGLIGMVRAFNRAEQPARAMEWLAHLEPATARTGEAQVERGLALDLLGRSREAQAAYADALRANPANSETLRRLALSYALDEDYAVSLNLLEKIANEPGGIDQTRETLAVVYALSGQADTALQISLANSEIKTGSEAKLAFYQLLPRLDRIARARAAHLGHTNAHPVIQAAAATPPKSATTGPASLAASLTSAAQQLTLPELAAEDQAPATSLNKVSPSTGRVKTPRSSNDKSKAQRSEGI